MKYKELYTLIYEILDNIEIEYDISESYINSIYAIIKSQLKHIPKYMLKKKIIHDMMYKIIGEILNVSPIVMELSKMYQPVQRSKEWYKTRKQMITASDVGAAVVPL